MWRATLKSLWAHRWRLVRTSLAVALGVGFVAGTFVLTDTMRQKIDDIIATGSQGTDVIVRGEAEFRSVTASGQEKPVPAELLSLIQRIDGVQGARGSVFGFAVMVDKEGRPIQPTGPPTLGGAWQPGEFELVEGAPPSRPIDVVIDDVTAERYGFAVGDPIKVLFASTSGRFLIAGILRLPASYMGATIASFPLDTARRMLGRGNTYDSISVEAEAGVSEAELRDRVAGALPPGYEAVTQTAATAEAKDSLDQVMGFLTTALLVFAAVALFVGAFIIFNTFSILVAQRTREIGLLRAVGASRGQVTMSVLIEAVAVGVLASVVGLALGVVFAKAMILLLKAFGMEFAGTALQFLPRTVVVALLAGVAVTVVSAVSPARRATKVPPVVAIGGTIPPSAGSVRRRIVVGTLVTVIGVGGLLAGLFDLVAQPLVAVGVGATAIFIGVAMLSVLIARPVANAVGTPLEPLGLPARLGRQNAARSPRRTASTAAALMIGVGLVAFATIVAASLKTSATRVIEDSMRADYILQAGGVVPMGSGVSPSVAEKLREEAAIGVVSETRIGQFGLDGAATTVMGIDPSTVSDVMTFDGETRTAIAGLTDLGVLVRQRVAEDRGWRAGQKIDMEYQLGGSSPTTIQGVFDSDVTQADYLVTLGTFERNFPQQSDDTVMVMGAPGAPSGAVRAAVERAASEFPNVQIMDKVGFVEKQTRQVDALLAFIQALLALSILIALLGIANTLAMSMFERTRELGLLRAVGMSRGQLRAMVRWEAVIIGVIGALLGLLVGIFFGWALVRAMQDRGVTEFTLPLGRLAIYVVIAAIAGVVASLLPARRAARLDILDAIASQ